MTKYSQDYQDFVLEHAYYLGETEGERSRILQDGFSEESDELLWFDYDPFRYTKFLQGNYREPEDNNTIPLWHYDAEAEFKRHFVSEAGDVLYYVAASLSESGIDLGQAIESGSKIVGFDISNISGNTAINLPGSKPITESNNYFGWQFWDQPYYQIQPGQPDSSESVKFWFEHEPIPLPLSFIPDSKYVLATVLSYYRETMGNGLEMLIDEEKTVDAAGLVLSAIATVAAARCDTNMQTIIEHNIEKISRRAANQAIKDGEDPERSRPIGEERPKLTGFDLTRRMMNF